MDAREGVLEMSESDLLATRVTQARARVIPLARIFLIAFCFGRSKLFQ
jgi:hypothetical protein